MNLWEAFLITPLTTALLFFYRVLGENLGLAIIVLTLALRVLLFPLSMPSLRSLKAQQELKPQLDKLKKKHKNNRQALAMAQMELYKTRGVNPLAGCLPQILQLVILIALYRVFISNLQNGGLNNQFLFWDLSRRDPYFILPVAAAAAQFVLSKMMLPAVSQEHEVAHNLSKAKIASDRKIASKAKEGDFAAALQKQNLTLFPILTLFFGLQFPAGLMLYWFVSTLLQIPQQWLVLRSKTKN